jgi:hypothetical protein
MSDDEDAGASATGFPLWLPPLNPFDGDWSLYEPTVWAIFEADFVLRRAHWRGKPVLIDIEPMVSSRPYGYWHIGSGINQETKELLKPNAERCARMAWVRPMLEADPSAVRTWIGRDQNRVKVALPDFSFLVLLKELPDRVFLKTAYPAERATKRAAWLREYEGAEKR